MTEHWLSQNGYGGRNSNAIAPIGALKMLWSAIDALPDYKPSPGDPNMGVRMNAVALDGRVYATGPPLGDPRDTLNSYNREGVGLRSTVQCRSLTTGKLLNTILGRHRNGGRLHSGGSGIMGSDMHVGRFLAILRKDGVLHTHHGSDSSEYKEILIATGESPADAPLTISSGGNRSSFWVMDAENPLNWYAPKNTGSHSSFGNQEMNRYGACVAADNDLWRYTCSQKYIASKYDYIGQGQGMAVQLHRLTAGSTFAAPKRMQVGATHTDDTRSFIGYGAEHCGGSPRGVGARIGGGLLLAAYATKPAPGAAMPFQPDYASGGLRLVGLKYDGTKVVKDLDIASGYVPPVGNYQRHTVQLAASPDGKWATIFQPKQSGGINATLIIFDLQNKTSRVAPWTAADFESVTSVPGVYLEEASQAVIAGDSVHVVDPMKSAGYLQLRARSVTLATGAQVAPFVCTPIGSDGKPVPVFAETYSAPALVELLAVDGVLVAQVVFNHNKQALVAFGGAANAVPVYPAQAIIRLPASAGEWGGAPNPPLTFGTGEPVRFSAVGSNVPDGASVVCNWEFGDGKTAVGNEVEHVFDSWGKPGEVREVEVELNVNGATARKALKIIDAGPARFVAIAPVAVGTPDKQNVLSKALLPAPAIDPWEQDRIVLFDFDVGAAPAGQARLRFNGFWHGLPKTEPTSIEVCLAGGPWTPGSVSYKNQPPAGAVLGGTEFGHIRSACVLTLDISIGDLPAGKSRLLLRGGPKTYSEEHRNLYVDIASVRLLVATDGAAPPPPPPVSDTIRFDAQDYFVVIPRGGWSWEHVAGGIQALPNNGGAILTNVEMFSPEAVYNVNLTAGTWRLWIMGKGKSLTDDSVWAGLDGKAVPTAMASFKAGGSWIMAILPAVTADGPHTINLWMREDGVVVEKLILTRDTGFVP